jgi:hypothetical protein
MRRIQAVRSSINVCRSRARERHRRTCSGAIQGSGSRPSASSSRRQRASSRSVLGPGACTPATPASPPAMPDAAPRPPPPARRTRTASRCTPPPRRRSCARQTAPPSEPRPAGVESIRPRVTSPESVSNASKVIWADARQTRLRSPSGASSEFQPSATPRTISRRAEGAQLMPSFRDEERPGKARRALSHCAGAPGLLRRHEEKEDHMT